MNQLEINEIFERTISECRSVLCSKANEYVGEGDRLDNFKQAAKLQREKISTALGGMLAKHTISIFDMIARHEAGEEFTAEKWGEKIIDHINYLILLQAVLAEERKGTAQTESHIPGCDHCVSCGADIPEGRQVCYICANGAAT